MDGRAVLRPQRELHRGPYRTEVEPRVELLRPALVICANPQVFDLSGSRDRCPSQGAAQSSAAVLWLDVDLGDLGLQTIPRKLGEGDRLASRSDRQDLHQQARDVALRRGVCQATRRPLTAS